jgi:multiple sugar transport system permease protein
MAINENVINDAKSRNTILQNFKPLRKKKPFRVFLRENLETIGVLFLSFFLFFPFAWMVLSSFKPSIDIFKYSFDFTWRTLLPSNPTLQNYEYIFGDPYYFIRNILNSIIVATGQVICTTIICSLAAYVFSRMHFKGRDLLFGAVLLTSFIPIEISMVPLFWVMLNLNLTSSYVSLFLPFIFSPFGVFLLRQAFLDIPKEYDEVAMLDGASRLQILWHIILPSAKSALITQALVQFMFSWNNFLWPLVVNQDPKKQVAQVAMAIFIEAGSNRPLWGEAFAAATISTIPMLILFYSLQRYYIRGILMTGLKG